MQFKCNISIENSFYSPYRTIMLQLIIDAGFNMAKYFKKISVFRRLQVFILYIMQSR